MQFTADQVWACAAAAHRINGEYVKMDVWQHNATPPFILKRANKDMVKQWLRTNDFVEVTEADYAAGREARIISRATLSKLSQDNSTNSNRLLCGSLPRMNLLGATCTISL